MSSLPRSVFRYKPTNLRRLLTSDGQPQHNRVLCNHIATETASCENSSISNPYKTLHPWKNLNDFTSFISEMVFYNSGHSSRSLIPETKYSLEEALLGLKDQLGLQDLIILKCTEKFTSGVCLLATNEKSAKKAQKSIISTSSLRLPYQVYWALTKGHPVPERLSERVCLKKISVGENEKLAEIVFKISKGEAERKNVKPVQVDYSILQSNKQLRVSLCQIATTTNKAHFTRLYLTRRTACILGDTLFGYRLKQIMGRTIIADPKTCNHHTDPLPVLGRDVMERLGLSDGGGEAMTQLPVMLHLRSLILPRWLGKNRDLTLTAPLPDHFSWTCFQLGLDPFPTQTVLPICLESQ